MEVNTLEELILIKGKIVGNAVFKLLFLNVLMWCLNWGLTLVKATYGNPSESLIYLQQELSKGGFNNTWCYTILQQTTPHCRRPHPSPSKDASRLEKWTEWFQLAPQHEHGGPFEWCWTVVWPCSLFLLHSTPRFLRFPLAGCGNGVKNSTSYPSPAVEKWLSTTLESWLKDSPHRSDVFAIIYFGRVPTTHPADPSCGILNHQKAST